MDRGAAGYHTQFFVGGGGADFFILDIHRYTL